ncbi:MAG: hypothetical protein ACNI25_09490 [Halarcobacter sp.]
MSEYIINLEFDSNYIIEDPINKTVYEIASYIKNEKNYDKAFQTIINNNLSLEDVITRTCRLDQDDVVILADLIISKS